MTEPFPKSAQLARGPKRNARKRARRAQWEAIDVEKGTRCRLCRVFEDARMFEYVRTGPIHRHHLVRKGSPDFGEDVADNIIPLHDSCHRDVHERRGNACERLCLFLSDEEYDYAIRRGGPGFFERAYGVDVGHVYAERRLNEAEVMHDSTPL